MPVPEPPVPEPQRLAAVLVAALWSGGVREVVLSPGSRSAPVALALVAAERAGGPRLHVRIDERVAGFTALGLAAASGRPVAVLTTSGTAVANLHPAVLEAWHRHLPLLALTADRPLAWAATGANQTTQQPGIFGRHVRGDGLLQAAGEGPADAAARAEQEAGWRWEIRRLLGLAVGHRTRLPGPVHLDLALGEPLVAPLPAPPPFVQPVEGLPVPEPVEGPPTVLPAGPRTLLVAGDLPPAAGRAAAALAARARWPLLAEPSSNARRGPAALSLGRLLLGGERAAALERVVVLGRPTLSRPATRLLGRRDVETVVVSPDADWPDPGRAADRVLDAVDVDGPGDESWWRSWADADAAARAGIDAVLADLPYLSGPAVAAALWAALGPADVVVAGSSNPVRDLDLAVVRPDPPTVYANRGLAGIDGTIATAMGVALATRRPTHGYLGDLTLLHDQSALLLGPEEPAPDLRLVVANDDGGSIFATLEQGSEVHAAAFERAFGTPQHADLAALAAVSGTRYARVTDLDGLRAALATPPSGRELVEVVIDRAHRRALDQALASVGAAAG